MGETIFRNEGKADEMYKMVRWHLYSDPFGDYAIGINIKSLRTVIINTDGEITEHISKFINEPHEYFNGRQPDGKFSYFLNKIRVMAEYEYHMAVWKNIHLL